VKGSAIESIASPPKSYLHFWGLGVVVIIGVFLVGSMFGGKWLESESIKAIQENKVLRRQVDSLEVEKIEFQRKVLMMESSSKIDRFVVDDSQKRMQMLDAEVAKLKDELAFYRKIIEPTVNNVALVIPTLRVFKNPELNFRLGLSKGTKTKEVVKGKAYFTFTGTVNGEYQSIELEDVDARRQPAIDFQFKRFQLLSASMKWPEGFKPETVELRLILKGKRAKEIKKSWQWSEVIQG